MQALGVIADAIGNLNEPYITAQHLYAMKWIDAMPEDLERAMMLTKLSEESSTIALETKKKFRQNPPPQSFFGSYISCFQGDSTASIKGKRVVMFKDYDANCKILRGFAEEALQLIQTQESIVVNNIDEFAKMQKRKLIPGFKVIVDANEDGLAILNQLVADAEIY